MNIKISRLTILNMIESFFTTWAFMKASRMEPGNILTVVIFIFSYFTYRHISIRISEKPFSYTPNARLTAKILSFLFTLFYMIIDYPNYIQELTNRFFQAVILVVVSVGFFICFYKVLLLLFSYSGDKDTLKNLIYKPENATTMKNLPFYCFLACLFCWLPYFLYQYPGIMSPDSINQLEQVMGLISYNNHHPFVHTMLFKLFYQIGMAITHSKVVAVSFYTFFQMCFLAFSVAYFLKTLRIFKVRDGILILITCFYALVPYHAVFSIIICKDVPFAAAVLLFSCSMLRMEKGITPMLLAFFICSGIMVCLFRSNGWYGFLFCLPFLVFFYRRYAKRIYPALGVILFMVVLIKHPVMDALDVTQPDLIEALSIPTQQIAAVICNDRELKEEQLALIENVVDLTHIKDLYQPNFADNMKELVRAGNQEYLVAHKWEFFKLWFNLGCTYPADFLKAYIDQTSGYWYPDTFYSVADIEGIWRPDLVGVSTTSLIRGSVVVKAKEIFLKLGNMVPVYSLLWSMGIVFWILLFCIGNAFVRNEKAKLIYYLPSFAIYLTVIIATPVATEFRYVYFMVFSLPFYLLTAILSPIEHAGE